MKHIVKTQSEESEQFELWKRTWQLSKKDLLSNPLLREQKKEIWEKLSGKDKTNVKKSLLQEQGFICCYCQQRIRLDNKTIIEHFVARDTAPEKMFDYENILACCDGGDEERKNQKGQAVRAAERTPQYCSSKKDNEKLLINPLNEDCETHFCYVFNEDPEKPELRIEGLSKQGWDTIKKLNLDIPKFNKLRGAVLAAFIFDETEDGYVRLSNQDIQSIAVAIKQKQNAEFQPFCAALEYILKNE